jgi:hypothetical protein
MPTLDKKSLSEMDIRSFPFPVVPLSERKRIIAKVDELRRLEARLAAARTAGTHLLDASIHELL